MKNIFNIRIHVFTKKKEEKISQNKTLKKRLDQIPYFVSRNRNLISNKF